MLVMIQKISAEWKQRRDKREIRAFDSQFDITMLCFLKTQAWRRCASDANKCANNGMCSSQTALKTRLKQSKMER